MTDPCTEKENIKKLFEFHGQAKDIIHEVHVTQTKMESDIAHIKGRIDNGMSKTLDEIKQYFNEFKGRVAHHHDVITRIEDIGWWTVKIGLAGAALAGLYWLAGHGWKP